MLVHIELSVNPSNTEMMLFTRKCKVESLHPVIFHGKEHAVQAGEVLRGHL